MSCSVLTSIGRFPVSVLQALSTQHTTIFKSRPLSLNLSANSKSLERSIEYRTLRHFFRVVEEEEAIAKQKKGKSITKTEMGLDMTLSMNGKLTENSHNFDEKPGRKIYAKNDELLCSNISTVVLLLGGRSTERHKTGDENGGSKARPVNNIKYRALGRVTNIKFHIFQSVIPLFYALQFVLNLKPSAKLITRKNGSPSIGSHQSHLFSLNHVSLVQNSLNHTYFCS